MELLPFDGSGTLELCDELDMWKTRLDYRGPLPRRWAGRLRRDLEAEAIAASTSMEGVPVTVEEVQRILAEEAPPEVRTEDRELVEGYREAMSFVLRRADDEGFRWNREIVVGLHDRILAGRHGQGAGRLRRERAAHVVDSRTGERVFLPPPGGDVAGLLDAACERMEKGFPHPAIASAWIHLAVAAIHPFRDGNGRVARVLASLAMYRGGFQRPEFTSLEEWWGRHLGDYYESFRCLGPEFDAEANATPFVTRHVEAQLRQVRALDARERVERRIWLTLEEVAEEANLHPRLADALWETFFGRDVTAGYYRTLADVSAPTATRDLGAAVSAGLLRAEGRRRGRRYLAGERLYGVVAERRSISAEGPPEAVRSQIVAELTRHLVEAGELPPTSGP